MKSLFSKVMTFALAFLCVCSIALSTEAFADDAISAADAYQTLCQTIIDGQYTCGVTGREYNFVGSIYKTSGGGREYWNGLFAVDSMTDITVSTQLFDSAKVSQLKPNSRQKFVENCISIANAMVLDTERDTYADGVDAHGVDVDTVNIFLEKIQSELGMGSEVLAAVLNNTKPDYTTASRIWEPFSGPISTGLGLLAIATMSLLGLSMAFDIAYVVIPAFQLLLDGDDSGSKDSKGVGKFVSKAAHDAVHENQGGGDSKSTKSQIGTYFKFRWKELVVVAICLLYLVQGQIWGLIAWLLNLFSGIIG